MQIKTIFVRVIRLQDRRDVILSITLHAANYFCLQIIRLFQPIVNKSLLYIFNWSFTNEQAFNKTDLMYKGKYTVIQMYLIRVYFLSRISLSNINSKIVHTIHIRFHTSI